MKCLPLAIPNTGDDATRCGDTQVSTSRHAHAERACRMQEGSMRSGWGGVPGGCRVIVCADAMNEGRPSTSVAQSGDTRSQGCRRDAEAGNMCAPRLE
eukprot:2073560-Prymnesium_polylepis.1